MGCSYWYGSINEHIFSLLLALLSQNNPNHPISVSSWIRKAAHRRNIGPHVLVINNTSMEVKLNFATRGCEVLSTVDFCRNIAGVLLFSNLCPSHANNRGLQVNSTSEYFATRIHIIAPEQDPLSVHEELHMSALFTVKNSTCLAWLTSCRMNCDAIQRIVFLSPQTSALTSKCLVHVRFGQ